MRENVARNVRLALADAVMAEAKHRLNPKGHTPVNVFPTGCRPDNRAGSPSTGHVHSGVSGLFA